MGRFESNNGAMAVSKWTNYIFGIEDKIYLELGICQGETFFQIKARKKYGVDSQHNTGTHLMTTDEFFSCFSSLGIPSIDVCYIDACHDYLQVVKDYANVYTHMNPNGLIICHDLVPPTLTHTDQFNCCDAYKFLYWAIIEKWAPDCYSAKDDFGCTVFPVASSRLPHRDRVELYIHVAYETFRSVLGPQHQLSNDQMIERIRSWK